MRALFSSVLAGLLLLPSTGVRAQTPGFAAGAEDGRVAEGVRADNSRGVPRVTSMTSSEKDRTNETFTVTILFSEDIRGFMLGDIDVRNGSTASSLDEVTDDRRYEVDIEPDEGVYGNVTVTIRAGAVESLSTSQDNAETFETFEVDTKGPEFEDATVDENELVLTYDEDLDESSEPDPDDYEVRVGNRNVIIFTVSVDDEEVTLILRDPVSKGDRVTLDYSPPSSDPIQDELGNEAELLARERVTNNTLTADDLPSAPTDLDATADGRTRIDLDWDAPDDDGGSRITGYRIEVSDTGDDGDWSDLESDTDDTKTSYTHTGIEPGTRQYYRVARDQPRGRRGPVVGCRQRHDRRRSPGCAQKPHRGRERKCADQPVVERADL